MTQEPDLFDPLKIHVELPAKGKLIDLINNPPLSVLMADSKAVRWVDALKREVAKLK